MCFFVWSISASALPIVFFCELLIDDMCGIPEVFCLNPFDKARFEQASIHRLVFFINIINSLNLRIFLTFGSFTFQCIHPKITTLLTDKWPVIYKAWNGGRNTLFRSLTRRPVHTLDNSCFSRGVLVLVEVMRQHLWFLTGSRARKVSTLKMEILFTLALLERNVTYM